MWTALGLMLRSSSAIRMSADFVKARPPMPNAAELSSAVASPANSDATQATPATYTDFMFPPFARGQNCPRRASRIFPFFPPREIGRHVLRDRQRKFGRPLLQE